MFFWSVKKIDQKVAINNHSLNPIIVHSQKKNMGQKFLNFNFDMIGE